jgi:hypothetical protein
MASLFDQALGALHATCDDWFATDAVFRPLSGPAVSGVKVERVQPETAFALGQASAIVGEAAFKVLKASLPKRPSKGDVFELGAEDWRVLESAAIEDDDGLRYTIKVERA